ncbi:mismatch repair protein MSH5, putative [Trypanosoma equiperdum]|nr:mismatch repair protein MSH5, putative [Trypanosoma equiperdum]
MDEGLDDIAENDVVVDVVSLIAHQGRVGLASYSSGLCVVHCSESFASRFDGDVPINSTMDVPGELLWLLQYLTICKPSSVLVPAAGSQVILDIARLCSLNVVFAPPSDFDSARLWDILAQLWANVKRAEWCARICVHKHVMLMTLAALLLHLQHSRHPVADVAEVPPAGVLYVDADTLSSLQIIRTEAHPMDYQGIGQSKEGLSLLSVVDRTSGPLGGALLRQWFALPLQNERELQQRYSVVDFFTNRDNHSIMTNLRRSLKRLRQPGSIFTKMRASKHTTGDYDSLLRSTLGLLQIASLLSTEAHRFPLFMRIVASCQAAQLEEMSDIITRSISLTREPRDTLGKTYVRIRPGCDPELDELREHFAHLDELLTRVAEEEKQGLPPHWRPGTLLCAFAPQWGHVIVLPHCPPTLLETELPRDWELVLQTDDGPFFKTSLTRRLDEEVGDLRSAILDREGEVQRRVDHRLLELSPALIPLHLCAELDCLIGFALCALEGQWSRPEIVPDAGVLEISRAVHPILARMSQPVVPCSLTIRRSADRVCVVTGANGSGKSVFITTIAHTVFLAHIGSYVPCAHAAIGLIDTFVALHTPSACRGNEDLTFAVKELHSSFGNELASMSRMLQRCGSRCRESDEGAARMLLVIDEFGKGTLSVDGAALLAASLRTFISMGNQRPLVLLATHYMEAVQPNIVPRGEIILIEMLTTLLESSRKRPRDGVRAHLGADSTDFVGGSYELVPSYNAVPVRNVGEDGKLPDDEVSSRALHFAFQHSVPEVLLRRAWSVMTSECV